MLIQSSQAKVYVAAKPTDMRKSFFGLLLSVQEYIDPKEIYEAIFLFFNRKKDRIKILHYDSNGFAFWYKLLDSGTYQLPTNKTEPHYAISLDDLNKILTEIKVSKRNNSGKIKPSFQDESPLLV